MLERVVLLCVGGNGNMTRFLTSCCLSCLLGAVEGEYGRPGPIRVFTHFSASKICHSIRTESTESPITLERQQMDPRMLAQRAQGQMQANVQAVQDCTRELFAWEEVMAAKDEALRQRKFRRERGEEDATDVREQGNVFYRDGNFEAALACYTRSLTLDRCVFFFTPRGGGGGGGGQ